MLGVFSMHMERCASKSGFLFPCILFVICRCSILGLVYKLTFMKRTKTELAKQMGVATIDLKDDVLLVL